MECYTSIIYKIKYHWKIIKIYPKLIDPCDKTDEIIQIKFIITSVNINGKSKYIYKRKVCKVLP